jgi:hypothetical protein
VPHGSQVRWVTQLSPFQLKDELIRYARISLVPELVAWWVGLHVLKLNPAAVPGIGYPVPLAIATIVLSIVGYFFALFV